MTGSTDPGQLRRLFDELAELGATEREARLATLEPTVRERLTKLLGHHESEGHFDALAGQMAGPPESDPEGVLERLQGAVEGRYRVIEQIGEGGMATVFLADDLRNERKVALKVLRPQLAQAVGAGRFLAEIRTTANLQHPHILPLFDSGEADGFLYYVMPYVADESLRHRLARDRQLPVDEALGIAIDVAAALHHAHQMGIVHRDVKPENILLTAGGPVIADFGVALLLADERQTEIGVRVGTPRYMSPEQATGSHPVGPASDVFALGCVLYEMLVGTPAHSGRTPHAILAEIVAGDRVSVGAHRPRIPQAVDDAVMRSLEVLPADRYGSAKEFADALRATGTAPAPKRPIGGPLALGMVAVAALAAVMFYPRGERSPAPAATEPAARQVTFSGDVLSAAISPGGDEVAFIAGVEGQTQRLMRGSIEGSRPIELFESSAFLYTPEWSPDARSISFTEFQNMSEDQAAALRLRLIDPGGNAPPRTVPTNNHYASWTADGSKLIRWSARNNSVSTLDVATRSTADSLYLDLEMEWLLGAVVAPGGDRVAFATASDGGNQLWVSPLTSGAADLTLLHQDSVPINTPVWSPDERSIYFARSLDASGVEVWRVDLAGDGNSVRETTRVVGPVPMQVRFGIHPGFTITKDGSDLLYTHRLSTSNLVRVELTASGQVESEHALTSGTATRATPRLSPDGRRVAYVQDDSRGSHIAVMDVTGDAQSQLTFLDGEVWSPAWSPSGEELAFGSNHTGLRVWTVSVRDGSTFERTQTAYEAMNHITWPASSRLLYQSLGDVELVLLNPETGEETPGLGRGTRDVLYDPRGSPSGRWVAFHAAGPSGAPSLWIESTIDDERRQVAGHFAPIGWSGEEDTIYAMPGPRITTQTEVWRIPLEGGEPSLLAELPFAAKAWEVSISRDGRTIVAAVEEARTDAYLIENFDPNR